MDSPFFPLPNGSAPQFTCTNESLDAIMAGLEPKKGDTILAVGGSGDQAFAMLETCAHVVVVDIEPDQIAFIEHRKEALLRGDYWTFARRAHIAPDAQPDFGVRLVERDDYFKDSERLQRMHENLGNLTLLPPADVFDVLKTGVADITFTKLYLSNVFGFGVVAPSKQFHLIHDAPPAGGAVYITDQPSICNRHPVVLSTESFCELWCNHFLSFGMRIDAQKSLRARELEYASNLKKAWCPVVYEKVA